LLRALGEARIESVVKFSERAITTALYGILLWKDVTDPQMYAAAFACGVIIALGLSLWQGEKVGRIAIGDGELPTEWNSNKSLVIAALPFAVTLGILPYVTKLEKFLLAGLSGYEEVSIFHVAQLAWIAGLMLPQAMRAALLPYLGEVRDDPEEFSFRMLKAHHITIVLLPIGLLTGFLIVNFSIPQFFGEEYLDSIPVFEILLGGWAITLLAVPWYVALQAGNNPWRFTILLGLVVLAAGLSGWYLIPIVGVMGAAWASLIGTSVMLSVSKLICLDKDYLTDGLALLSVITCYQLSINSWFALVGFFTVIPAIESMRFLLSQRENDQEE
jgi:O-antigen/teichoic acid export membrane protein